MSRDLGAVQFYLDRGKWDEALAQIQNLLASHPDDAALWSMRAHVLRNAEKPDEAIESARRSIELDPEASSGFAAMALALSDKHRLAEAMQAIDEAIERDPHDSGYRYLKGAIFAQQKRWEEALDEATAAIQLDPENEQALNLKSHALDRLGRVNEAEAELEKALRLNPENPQTYTQKGWVALTRGRHEEALENFREAMRLDPTDDAARAGIAEAMRNRNLLYRVMYKYYDFMSRFTAAYQWAFIVGYLVLSRSTRVLAKNFPALSPFILPFMMLLIVFAYSTWLARPLMNMVLFFDRFGYHALTRRDIYGAFVTTALTAVALFTALGAFLDVMFLRFAAAGLVVACISSTIFVATGWRRWVLALVTCALFVSQPALMELYRTISVEIGQPIPLTVVLGFMIFWGLAAFGSMFLANALIMGERE